MAMGFSVMTLIMIPCLVSNLIGEYYEDRNQSVLDYTTLGNQVGYQTGTTDPNAMNIDDKNEEERAIYLTSDLINTIALYIFIIIFKIVCQQKISAVMRRTQTPSDYSIYVTGFPDDAVTKEDVRNHFSKWGKIEEIIFARRFAKMIGDYTDQDNLNKKLKKREITVKVKARDNGEDPVQAVRNDEKCQKLVKKDNEMEEELRNKYPNVKSINDVPKIGVFVIFNEAEDSVKCEKHYKKFHISSKEDLKLNGKYKLKVTTADEPSNIKWENLEVGKIESFLRSALVGCIVVVLLICTLFAVYWLRTYQNNLPQVEDCDQYQDLTIDTVDRSNSDALD